MKQHIVYTISLIGLCAFSISADATACTGICALSKTTTETEPELIERAQKIEKPNNISDAFAKTGSEETFVKAVNKPSGFARIGFKSKKSYVYEYACLIDDKILVIIDSQDKKHIIDFRPMFGEYKVVIGSDVNQCIRNNEEINNLDVTDTFKHMVLDLGQLPKTRGPKTIVNYHTACATIKYTN